MKKLLIFPYNGNGLEALDCLDDQFEFIGFIDDTKEKQGTDTNGNHIFSRDALLKYPEAKVLAVMGSPTSFLFRKNIIDDLKIPLERYANVISSKASVSKIATIGSNVLIMPGVVITSNAMIGNHVVILPNTVIHHDSQIGDYSLIGSNVTVAGHTKVGTNCYIGSGSSIIDNIMIGENTLIGIGSNVIGSFPSNAKIAGNPAKQI